MLTTASEWNSLLADWLPAARAAQPDLPASLSFPPATISDITAAESRLKLTVPLPPSYRAFLLATNGWRFASHAVPLLRSTKQLTWFKKQNREWIIALTDPSLRPLPVPPEETYYNYSPSTAEEFLPAHLTHTLQISDVGDAAVYLLNPMVVHHDGEWEAWFLASWLPGVHRYRSFAALMQSEYHALVGQPLAARANAPVAFEELPTVYRDPPMKTPRRAEIRKARRLLAELIRISQDHSPRTTMNARIRAIQELAARRDPAAIAPLRGLLHDPLPDVRAHATIALGDLRAHEAVDDLINIVTNLEEGYHCAIASLGQIGTQQAIDFLVRHLESRSPNFMSAAMAIAPHGDPRAVAIMSRIMLDTTNRSDGGIAGSILAKFGPAGIEPLVAAASHSDAIVRSRAYKGLYELAFTRASTPEGQCAADTLRKRESAEPEPESTPLSTYLKIIPRVKTR